jgi:hypothetical protein
METNEKTMIKKTMWICGGALLFALIALGCILIFTSGRSRNQMGMLEGDILAGLNEMTFEEFRSGMKADLSQETLDEVKRIFEQMQQAAVENDAEKVMQLYAELNQLDVYDFNPQDLPEGVIGNAVILDQDGNAVDPDDLPEELQELIGG